MQIQKTNDVSFGASVVRHIKLTGKNGKQFKANFIKFNTRRAKDVKALENIRTLWGGRNLSAGISEEAKILGKDSYIYGLTLQNNNFCDVDGSKVLGLVSTSKVVRGNDTEIFKIGTNPKYAYEQKHSRRSIKNIAKLMLDAIKDLNGNKSLFASNVEENEKRFVEKVGIRMKNN